MNKQEYMSQLKEKLRRLPKEDFEQAVAYYEEYFADAGAENEAKAIEDLGTPQEAAEQIIRDMAFQYTKEPVKNVKKGFHALWVVMLAMFAAPIALPLLFAGVILLAAAALVVFAMLFSALVMAVCAVITGPLTIVAGFTVVAKSVPVFLTCLGIGLAATGIGAACTYGMYVLCRCFLGCLLRSVGKIAKKGGKGHA